MIHSVFDLIHWWPLAGFFVPAACHQSLYGFWKVFDQRGSSTCRSNQSARREQWFPLSPLWTKLRIMSREKTSFGVYTQMSRKSSTNISLTYLIQHYFCEFVRALQTNLEVSQTRLWTRIDDENYDGEKITWRLQLQRDFWMNENNKKW